MKKLICLVTSAVLLVCVMSVFVSAEVKYLADAEIPYGTVSIDGNLGDWNKSAKFTMNASNAMIVAGSIASDFVWTTYLMYDNDYLYIAYEVTDSDGGRLFFGGSGDILDLLYDINGIGAENGNINLHDALIRTIPVVAGSGSRDISGVGVTYPASNANANNWVEIANDKKILNNIASDGSGNNYVIEQRIKWSDLKSMIKTVYPGAAEPEIKAGTVFTFMPSFYNANDDYSSNAIGNGVHTVWAIGQNSGYVDPNGTEVTFAAGVPTCYGFRGILADKSAQTGDITSIAALIFSLAAGVCFIARKKG